MKRQLERCGFHIDVSWGDADDPISALLRVDDPYGNRVDLLVGLRGAPQELFSRVIEVPFQGTLLKFAAREDFIAMKAFAGGPVDLHDASCAISAAGDTLDTTLLRRIAAGFGRHTAETVERLIASTGQ